MSEKDSERILEINHMVPELLGQMKAVSQLLTILVAELLDSQQRQRLLEATEDLLSAAAAEALDEDNPPSTLEAIRTKHASEVFHDLTRVLRDKEGDLTR